MAEESKEKLNIRLHVYDEDIAMVLHNRNDEVYYRNAAKLRGNLSGKAGKTQHLCIQRQCISADCAQLSFRFMAVLFRNDQNRSLSFFLYSLFYFPVNKRRFPCSCFSGNQSEHLFFSQII